MIPTDAGVEPESVATGCDRDQSGTVDRKGCWQSSIDIAGGNDYNNNDDDVDGGEPTDGHASSTTVSVRRHRGLFLRTSRLTGKTGRI